MGVSIEEILEGVKRPIRSVSICLDADLQAEHDQLTEDLDELRRAGRARMTDGVRERELAQRIRDLEERMRASERVFRFQGLSRSQRVKIEGKYPPPDPNPERLRWDINKGAPELLAASAVEPEMTEAQAAKLLEALSEGQADRLVGCAWLATTGSTQVPFSERASELTGDSDSK